MISRMLKCHVASESQMRQVLQVIVMLMAAILFVAGVYEIAKLDLTEAELFLGLAILMSLVLQCFVVWCLIDLRLKAD